MFVSLCTAQNLGEFWFWGKGVHFPGFFLMDKKGKGFGEEDEVEMELKIVGKVEKGR
jgi:hypothetical protein